MEQNLYALIMAGGGGTRLWPLSRRDHPKQALQLFGDRTMFQYAVDRLLPLLPPERIFVVTAEEQVRILSLQYPELPLANYIIEPEGRGTASCIALSAMHLHRIDPEAVMVVVTADHFVRDVTNFCMMLRVAKSVAELGYLVTLGVKPTYASTGYGYIHRGDILGEINNQTYYAVNEFTEKPDAVVADKFLRQGNYLWNSGMFIWRVDVILSEVQNYLPQLHQVVERLKSALDNQNYESTLQKTWPDLAKQTIDYGIMEKASQVAVLPVDFGWFDIGIWDSVMGMHDQDKDGNILLGDVFDQHSHDIMVISNTDRMVATIGLADIIVIDTPDALLITRRDQSENVKSIVDYLRKQSRLDIL
jgi:mannose-1-phosphate guanylyltransferase